MTSISITSKKHGHVRAVIAPHLGWAAVLLAVAAVVYALGWFVVNVIGAWHGRGVTGTNPYGTVDIKPQVEPAPLKQTVAAAPQPTPTPEKIAPVAEPQASVQSAPEKKPDTQITEVSPKIETPPSLEVGGQQKTKIQKPPLRIAKRDYGNVTIITPFQGDEFLGFERNSFVDEGVRYKVEVLNCSKKLRSMYLQCWYPVNKPRPPVYNW